MRSLALRSFLPSIGITLAASVAMLLGALVVEAQAPVAEEYADRVTGTRFRAPPGLHLLPARPGYDGRTTQTVISTYADPLERRKRVDHAQELTIAMYIERRPPAVDLRSWVLGQVPGDVAVAEIPRLRAVVITGTFAAGARTYAFIPYGPDRVLIIDAYPAYSTKIGILDALLATLSVEVK